MSINVEFGDEVVEKKRVMRKVDRDTIVVSINSIKDGIEKEIEKIRNAPTNSKSTGIKFLKSQIKNLKVLGKDYARVLKTFPKTTKKDRSNTGFEKPIKISDELLEFLKQPEVEESVNNIKKGGGKELYEKFKEEYKISRSGVTKMVCAYIKNKDLQDPKDGRFILPDKTLTVLLKYDYPWEHGPLSYTSLQQYIQIHYPKQVKEIKEEEDVEE